MEPGRLFVPVSFFCDFGHHMGWPYVQAVLVGSCHGMTLLGKIYFLYLVSNSNVSIAMTGKYKVITLCGSTKFREEFLAEQKRLTLEGNIVISVGLFGHSGDTEVWLEETKIMLDDMHKRKIDMADEIFVINVGGYIGESTKNEIEYALNTGKAVKYLVN